MASILIELIVVPVSPLDTLNFLSELSVKVPYWTVTPNSDVSPVSLERRVSSDTVMLRPSAAIKLTPRASVPPSTAVTPVWPEMALIAAIVTVRFAVSSAVVVNDAVATPLIFTEPVAPTEATIAEPFIWFELTVADTPVNLERALIAAALEMELLVVSREDAVSYCVSEAPTTAPLILKSPDAKAAPPPVAVAA